MTILPSENGVGRPPILPEVTLNKTPVHRLQRFVWIKYWSLDDCLALLGWYLTYERHYRGGWNNNMSLTNYDADPADKEITWSLMIYKLEYFKVSYALIIPFKIRADSRGIPRAYTTFTLLKENAVVYCRNTNRVLTDTDRSPVIEALAKHIRLCFNWRDNSKANKQPIHRYRLLTILNSPDVKLSSDIDVHHKDGINKILNNNCADLDDRARNLQVLPRSEHYQIHHENLDSNWVDM